MPNSKLVVIISDSETEYIPSDSEYEEDIITVASESDDDLPQVVLHVPLVRGRSPSVDRGYPPPAKRNCPGLPAGSGTGNGPATSTRVRVFQESGKNDWSEKSVHE